MSVRECKSRPVLVRGRSLPVSEHTLLSAMTEATLRSPPEMQIAEYVNSLEFFFRLLSESEAQSIARALAPRQQERD